MKTITYLDQLVNANELAVFAAHFQQNCFAYDEPDLKGVENILAEYDFLPNCMMFKTAYQGKSICIFNCEQFFGDRLLVAISSTLFQPSKMERLFECPDFLGVDYTEYHRKGYDDRPIFTKELRIITTYRAMTGLLPYVVFKSS